MPATLRVAALIIASSALAICLPSESSTVHGASQQSAPAAIPDLEGGWVRIDPEGSGSFGGLTSKFPRAVLTPAGAAMKVERDPDDVEEDYTRPRAPGEAYIVSQGRCGGPVRRGIDPNSAAVFIVQTTDGVLITREGPGGRRVHGRPAATGSGAVDANRHGTLRRPL